ncbi:recombinase RecT [Staphylococcus simulans]|uniref:recombinase RecT n=1 Tax=Staphylococcus simulans TaxID=1286 RepID=UPI00399A9A09
MSNNKLQKVEEQLLAEKNISDSVLNKVKVLEAKGNLELPKNYSPSNAMKQAWLKISQDFKLAKCTEASTANALLDMVTQGLNPAKDQCYFIPYGDKMQLQRSVFGNILLLKRDAGAKDVVAQIIYEDDSFKQELDSVGRIKGIKHEQDFFNIDKNKIKGAYCTIVFEDDRENYIEVMTMDQIEQAWLQSSMIKDEAALKKSKTHNNFKEEMAKKTVINRAAKRYINTSSDDGLLRFAQESEERQRKEVFDAEVEQNANKEEIDFEEAVYTEYQEPANEPKNEAFQKEEPAEEVGEDVEPF